MPGNDLLSHGETPHYHRRSSVSLLSSGWDQVGPERYCCQANRFEERSGSNRSGLEPGSPRLVKGLSNTETLLEFEYCNKVNVASV